MTTIETERLTLREFNESDAVFILQLVNEQSFLRYIGDRGVHSIEDARRYIADGPVSGYSRYGHGLMCVIRKSDGAAVGMCGVLKRDTLPEPDIGFSFFPEHWSQGYAFESASAIMKHAREVLGLGRILAITTIDNESSIRLLGKLGFRFDRLVKVGDDATELRLFISDP